MASCIESSQAVPQRLAAQRGLAIDTPVDPLRRLAAYAIDWSVFASWAGVVFAVAWLGQGGELAWPANPWLAQALGFSLTTLPFGLYFALMECSARQATLGKRILGLRVVTVGGGRPSRVRCLARAAVKLLPWELGHLATYQLTALGPEQDAPAWLIVAFTAALVGAAWFVVSLWSASGRTPYDHLAGTLVVRRNPTVEDRPVRL